MSRNLIVNGQRKWTPSPEMAIKEEYRDEESRATTNENTIEEIDEETEEDEEDEDEEEEEGSGFSSSPSIPDENINFDLVYTLHSFEATVDGQATVKKGDALTLLDDSNSYWWLIRDLKTSEVGYIPAENIETPFERLARLNKHRNITSLEQASYFTQNEAKKNIGGSRKKVILSTSLNVQLQILITGENEEDIEDEAYEEWDEEMLDDDEEDEEDDILNNDIGYTTTTTEDQIVEVHQSEHTNRVTPTITASSPYHHRADSADSAAIIAAVNTRGLDIKSKVLRVYAGNVNVGASYHSVRVTEMTSVDELLSNAMEKFHISQIEIKQGHQHHSSCIEYYLTVKTRDGDEITLDPQDKPYAIHESLTAHLTTPMPSLTQFRQLVSTHSDYYINKKKKSSKTSSVADLQFCMHKRIKHVNDKNGQVHIKVSLMTTKTIKVAAEKLNPIRKMTSLRRFGSNRKKTNINNERFELERIDKLIAIPASITIADLTSTALVKFHIIPDIGQPHHYKLVLNLNGESMLCVFSRLSCKTIESYLLMYIFTYIYIYR
ncbi:MAG: hypothetical protein EXX96DRAFT_177040 [Benjaminiella poitrasii]|nr:MAG: hypothetical protein EXX96DRAFT_177040 [Benjaminiella poitrasii]